VPAIAQPPESPVDGLGATHLLFVSQTFGATQSATDPQSLLQ
jgi:hypothetical protein